MNIFDKISLSLICSDPLNLDSDLAFLQEQGLKKIHIDIMDNKFVPRFGIFPEITSLINKKYPFELDAHFMVEDIPRALNEWKKYNAFTKISYHYSANKNRLKYIDDLINESGAIPIYAFDLDIDEQEFLDVILENNPSGIMILGIKPGVLAQEHKPELVLDKLNLLKQHSINIETIMIDGGVNFHTISEFLLCGANHLVCGSGTIYKNIDFHKGSKKNEIIKENCAKLKELIG